MDKVKVLFVCMGNICRSPTAHGVFRALVQANNLQSVIDIDSAGTHAYHSGEPPDRRAQQTATQRGIDLSDLRARAVSNKDFDKYDYILAMDEANFMSLQSSCPEDIQHKIRLFLSFAPQLNRREVPDPYYGGQRGFENVFDMIEQASQGLLDDIQRQHFPKKPASGQ
jgi:protein-tyrosine phosphatase